MAKGDKAGLDSVARSGGWRIFMRSSAEELSDRLMHSGEDVRRGCHKLSLARAFVLAKHGRTGEARRQIDRVKAATEGDAAADPLLLCDLVLVDAHIRVYEDRPLATSDARRLLQVLDTLPNTDPIGQALALTRTSHTGHSLRGAVPPTG